jgi:MarR family 2-MHQ and catechol resistance regulon transcriptional repressor
MNSRHAIISILKTSAFISEIILSGLKPYEISEQQFNVLRILRGQKGIAANLFTVQDRMVHKRSNTTRLIDKLIQKKLVKRNVCIKNRRKIELFITEDGLDFLKKIDPITDEIEKKVLKNISSKDLNSLISILNSIN